MSIRWCRSKTKCYVPLVADTRRGHAGNFQVGGYVNERRNHVVAFTALDKRFNFTSQQACFYCGPRPATVPPSPGGIAFYQFEQGSTSCLVVGLSCRTTVCVCSGKQLCGHIIDEYRVCRKPDWLALQSHALYPINFLGLGIKDFIDTGIVRVEFVRARQLSFRKPAKHAGVPNLAGKLIFPGTYSYQIRPPACASQFDCRPDPAFYRKSVRQSPARAHAPGTQ